MTGVFIQTLYYSWGAWRSYLATGMLFALAFQLSFRPEYCPAPDFLTRSLPTYNPTNSNGPFNGFINQFFGMFLSVPDNACVRSNLKSDLTFDFIVVGAGAAGSVIAAGLSENPKWKVLLIEAGGDTVIESVPPQYASFGVNNSRVWKYNSEVSDTACQAYKDGCPMPCGKQLSGSTGTNSMMYVCGQSRDYDDWEALGNPGWGYKNMRELIKENERNSDPKRNSTYHGFTGKLTVSNNTFRDPFQDVVTKGFNRIGYKTLTDYNAEQYNGVVRLQSTIKNGERENAYLAFIEPIKNKKNLFIVKNGLVTNILFDGTKAIGVNVKTSRHTCRNIEFKASKEVIISSGGLNSPKILLQSGIGPKEDLENLGIEVVHDSPGVGSNFHDHIFSSHFLKIYPNSAAQSTPYLFASAFQYLVSRTGYFSHFSTTNMNGFINATNNASTYSNLQILLTRIDRQQVDLNVAMSNYGLKDSYVAEILKADDGNQIVQVFTTLLNPIARGKVELRGKDPELKPKITGNFLTNPEDIATILGGIKKVRQLVDTPEFKNINASIIKFDIPECEGFDYPSDEYEECYIKYVTAVLWHPVGTCKMGPASDTQAVVDPTLKVYGVQGLRVADASIMPKIISGNTQCPTYAIGRKAVELIKKAWASAYDAQVTQYNSKFIGETMLSVYNTWGSSSSVKTKLFLATLSIWLSPRPEYCPAPDYLTRSTPTYNATNTSGPVPDSGCCRAKYGSDLTFDFIVVGAGAAGSVIAAGLSDNPNYKVLLIEAGSDLVVETVVPQMAPFVVNSTSVWKYNAEVTNTSCQAYKDGCPMPCGKQMSGSTGANAMMYVCGQSRDYDDWEALGNPGWGYQNMRELIKKSEKNSDLKRSSTYHGFTGKLAVSNTVYDDKFKDVVVKGFNRIGYKTLTDYNNEQYNGVVDLQSTIEKGERENAYLAFIEPIKNRSNLFIAKEGLVTNILFNGTKAIGVNVKTSLLAALQFCPSNIQFKASKEVIMSAGGLNSPKILLQSGIGPKEDLNKLGIPVVYDSPGVGNNYHDHILALHFLKVYPNSTNQTDAYLDAAGWEYLFWRTGYFTHFSTINMNGFINASDPSSNYSDIQMIFSRVDRKQLDYNVALSNYGLKDSYVAEIEKANLDGQIVQVYTTLLNPIARGKVELRGRDPGLKPKITGNFLTNPEDVAKLVEGIKKLRQLVDTPEFKAINATFVKFDISECNNIAYPSDEYEQCYLKYLTTVLWHPVGTCKMGPATDPQAVVDPTLKVKGVQNLRVADASIMPKITSGNTQCPTYAIGQKALELILQTWA